MILSELSASAVKPFVIIIIAGLAILHAYNTGYDAGLNKGLNQASQASAELVGKLKNEKLAILKELADVDQKYTDDLLIMQDRINSAKREAYEYQHITHQGDSDTCHNISDEWVRVHDKAAELSGVSDVSGIRDAEAARVDDGSAKASENYSRDYTKKQAIQVITDNYAQCAEYMNQLRALQTYVNTLIAKEKTVAK